MNTRIFFKIMTEIAYFFCKNLVISLLKIFGPPRILFFNPRLNSDILRAFGAHLGKDNVRIYSPIVLHAAEKGYSNLVIMDGCIVNGNVFLDLSGKICLKKGASLGPGVIIMTHNNYNHNQFLVNNLLHTCGIKGVLIEEGVGVKAGVLITMGVRIGKNSVIAGGAVVNRDIPDNCFAVGVPARVVKEIGK